MRHSDWPADLRGSGAGQGSHLHGEKAPSVRFRANFRSILSRMSADHRLSDVAQLQSLNSKFARLMDFVSSQVAGTAEPEMDPAEVTSRLLDVLRSAKDEVAEQYAAALSHSYRHRAPHSSYFAEKKPTSEPRFKKSPRKTMRLKKKSRH